MATEQGRETRLYISVGAGEAAVDTPVGGETSLDWKRASTQLDTSSKDDGIYGSSDYGQQKITISVSGNTKLPDPGLEAVETASKASPPQASFKIKRGEVVRYAGVMAIGNFSASFPNSGVATYSFDLANAGAPTTDDLTATA